MKNEIVDNRSNLIKKCLMLKLKINEIDCLLPTK
jgi:hypothetical protein